MLDLIQSAYFDYENLESIRPTIEARCDLLTLRGKVIKKHKQVQSLTNPAISLHIFKLELNDLVEGSSKNKRAFFMVKHSKSTKELRLIIGENYLLDRVKLAINKRGEIVLSSTSNTVIR